MKNDFTSTNRLVSTTSPYLLQHAHNPVDWYPWGEEAFTKARDEHKPIFLSIGYSACHWCHVMERESFENESVAAFLNEHFVSIKVDREERPDVDDIYMTAVQMMTGAGGWPLSVFLTNDLKPFYGGTYFPPEDRFGRPGFLRLLQMIEDAWRSRPQEVSRSADHLTEALQRNSAIEPTRSEELSSLDMDRAARLVAGAFDPFRGGFGEAPKFPPTAQMELLLRVWKRTGNAEYLEMVERTLQRMSAGGINDQLAGGFARYSTDADWLVPHFEKMLYDNALLIVNLLECYQATSKSEYLEMARATLDWALAELRDEAGGFHSSYDADSEGVEGKYYVWKPEEIIDVLGAADAELFAEIYDVTERGNFEHGFSILHQTQRITEASKRYKIDEATLQVSLQSMRQQLKARRDRRSAPARDDKVLTDWNSLIITALTRGYRATGDERYLIAARETADFIMKHMWQQGKLLHSWRKGTSGAEALLDDHSFYLDALVELYQADFNPDYLVEAKKIVTELTGKYLDTVNGGFYFTAEGKTDLITRAKFAHDGATPSGNALIVRALNALSQILDAPEYAVLANGVVTGFAESIKRNPTAHLRITTEASALTQPSCQVTIIGKPTDNLVRNLLEIVNRGFFPGVIVVCGETDDASSPLFTGRTGVDGLPAAYFCSNSVCREPVTDPGELLELLDSHFSKAAN